MPKRTPRVSFELLEDKDGVKKWNIEAIHVTITGNKRKYTEDELKLGARSLGFRPVNINHDEELWLPHNPFNPEDSTDNRTLALTFIPKERGVAGKIQVADPEVNNMIASGEINRLSIEQIPTEGQECACNMLEGCFCEQNGVTFTGIALLTADTRPGDPETKITPESVQSIAEKLEKLKAKFKEQRPKKIEAETSPKPEELKPVVPKQEATIDQITNDVLDDMAKKIQAQYDLVNALEQKAALNPTDQFSADELANAKWSLFYMVMDYMKLKKGEKQTAKEQTVDDIKKQFYKELEKQIPLTV